eukprot:7663688-Pyramimonas_sp.AAC.1
MAEEIDPTEAALDDGESSDSGITDITCETDTPIKPDYAVTRDMEFSPGRRIAYRAPGVGWIIAYIAERRDADKYALAGKKSTYKEYGSQEARW